VDDLLIARSQMALSLAFHIVFAAIGVAMPVLMVLADVMHRRTRDPEWLAVHKAWAKGTAVFFAVGAVSGTVLSFELGLLFPGFMRHAGAIVGMPFSLEGFAFFLEAIFLGLYLYGRDKLPSRLHLAAGVGVAVAGLASLGFVMLVNAWMNAPVGFRVDAAGQLVDIDPIAAMRSPFALHEVLHMAAAAYMATGLGAAAIHAAILLRRKTDTSFHRKALAIALCVAIPATLAQPLIGHVAGQAVARHQPMKLAAMEGLFETQAHAPLALGGYVDTEARETKYAIHIPGLLSFISFDDTKAVVKGLDAFPEADWPSPVVHYAHQVMVGIGTLCAGLAAFAIFVWWRSRKRGGLSIHEHPWLLRGLVLTGPLGFIAIEAGWVVTEVGRQPWVIYDVLRTSASVTPMPGLIVPFVTFTLLYLGLSVAVVAIIARQVRKTL
jgi:cytochrome d ubiquinol oxidase subunit I